MTIGVTEFSMAVTRSPADSAVNGLRAVDRGQPDIIQMRNDHTDYCAALASTGAKIINLPPLDEFPDAQFVEDTALCLPEGVIFMAPGAESRRGEVACMQKDIAHLFGEVHHIDPPAFIEGGDILVTGREILVGLSDRTNPAGISALGAIVSRWGYQLREVKTPPGVLHFKTDCALLDDHVVLATSRLASSGCFDDYGVILTAEGEEAAANCIRFNDLVIMPAGFAATEARIKAAGFDLRTVNNSECAKIDGGMSCLSLRFNMSA
jgi:dimethylargininase